MSIARWLIQYDSEKKKVWKYLGRNFVKIVIIICLRLREIKVNLKINLYGVFNIYWILRILGAIYCEAKKFIEFTD